VATFMPVVCLFEIVKSHTWCIILITIFIWNWGSWLLWISFSLFCM